MGERFVKLGCDQTPYTAKRPYTQTEDRTTRLWTSRWSAPPASDSSSGQMAYTAKRPDSATSLRLHHSPTQNHYISLAVCS